jgi:putative DNA primase/helicase
LGFGHLSRRFEVTVDVVEGAVAAPAVVELPTVTEKTAIVTLFKSGEKAHGKRHAGTWERFYKALAEAKAPRVTSKLDLHGWSAATFKGDHRVLTGVEVVSAIVLDFDNTWKPQGAKKAEPLPLERRVAPESALALWKDTFSFYYTSWSHSPTLPKFREVIVTSRPMTAAEFPIVWRFAVERHENVGQVVDPQCKDASHLWFFGVRRDEHYGTGIIRGEPLDVDMVLAAAAVDLDVGMDEVPEATGTCGLDLKERARRYVGKMPEAISGSEGHKNTIKVAMALVRGFGLTAEDALDIMGHDYNPRCSPPWTEKELRHKVESAAKFTAVPEGYLLKRRSASAMLAEILSKSEPVTLESKRAPDDQPFTDDGNALRLVAGFGDVIRYVIEWKSYIRWNGKVWERDPEGHLVREDMRTLARRWADAALKIDDEESRKRAVAWAMKSQGAARLDAAVDLAKGDARIRIRSMEIDAHAFLLNTQNGILDLREIDDTKNECKLLAHDPKYLLTRITKVGYIPDAKCPTWGAFCTFSSGGDGDVESYRRRRRGSYLSGSPDKVFEVAFGKGDTGKTSYFATITTVMGSYAQKVSRTLFERQRNEQHPADLMELDGVRFVYGAEIEEQIDVKKVKDITGERVIKGRGMRQDWQSIVRRYKLAIFANDPPKIGRTVGDPIWNRVYADEWKNIILEKKSEAEIDEVYEKESEGILADLVRGWIQYRRVGLAPPASIVGVTAKYRDAEDPIEPWIAECIDIADIKTETLFKDLWSNRKEWLEENDPDRHETTKSFAMHLEQRGFIGGKNTKGAAIRIGIKLRDAVKSATADTLAKNDTMAETFDGDAVQAMLDAAMREEDEAERNRLLEAV